MARRDFAFGKENFIWIGISVLCIVLGFVLMSGGGSGDYSFNPEIAPVVTVAGFALMIFGILKTNKK